MTKSSRIVPPTRRDRSRPERRTHHGVGRRGSRQLTPAYVPAKR